MENRIKILEEFLIDEPKDVFTFYALALEYSKIGNFTKSIDLLLTVKSIDNDYLPLYFQLGKLYEIIGDKKNAILCYQEGVIIAKKQSNKHTLAELEFAIEDLE